jgi:hypothetical protein
MPVSFEDKILLIRKLQFVLSKTREAALRLRMAGEDDQSQEMMSKSDKLSDAIDGLIGQTMRDWSVNARGSIDKLKRASDSLQRSIKNIKDGIEVAKNVVRGLEKVDEFLEIAMEVTAAIA